MALAIELRGHDLRYAAEQALMAFLPAFGGEDKLVSTLLGDRAGQRLTELAGLLVAAGLLGLGFSLMLQERGAALGLAAIWLLLSQEAGEGLVNRREIV